MDYKDVSYRYNRSIIFDTNIWVAFFDCDDSTHDAAENILEKVARPILITEYIILEVVTVLTQKKSKKCAEEFMHMAQDNKDIDIIVFDYNFFTDVVETFTKYSRKDLSFVDCSLLMLSNSHEIITFDKKLVQAIKRNKEI